MCRSPCFKINRRPLDRQLFTRAIDFPFPWSGWAGTELHHNRIVVRIENAHDKLCAYGAQITSAFPHRGVRKSLHDDVSSTFDTLHGATAPKIMPGLA